MSNRSLDVWIAIGIAMGTGLGVAFKNIPVGVACGAGLGSVLGAVTRRRPPPKP